MPRGDKTGPNGLGPRTGRAAGYCSGNPVPGCMNSARGYRRGIARRYGRGWGRGSRRIGYAPEYQPTVQTLTREQEIANLENYQKQLEVEKSNIDQETKTIQNRIEELKKVKK